MECPYCEGTGKVEGDHLHIGDMFRLHRQNQRLTIRNVEDATGISNAYVSQIETGKVKSPSFDVVIKLADLYGISIEDLIDYTNIKDRK